MTGSKLTLIHLKKKLHLLLPHLTVSLLPLLPLWMNRLKQKYLLCRAPFPQGKGSNLASDEAKPGSWTRASCSTRLTIICHGFVLLSILQKEICVQGNFKNKQISVHINCVLLCTFLHMDGVCLFHSIVQILYEWRFLYTFFFHFPLYKCLSIYCTQ